MKKEWILITLILAIVLISISFLPLWENCGKRNFWNSRLFGVINCEQLISGQIIVGFHDNVTLEEALELIEFHGLSSDSSNDYYAYEGLGLILVFVPEGEEYEWIEVLEKEDIVRYANPNTYGEFFGTSKLS